MTDPKKEKQQQEEEQERKAPEEGKEQDPHRGTADTPSQHKGLDPDAARNNDDEDYNSKGSESQEPDDDGA